MRRTTTISLFTLALVAAAAPASTSQAFRPRLTDNSPSDRLTPAQTAFAATYVATVSATDLQRYKSLVHPSSLACMRKATEDYFAATLALRQGRRTSVPRVLIESLPPKIALNEAAARLGFTYPVRPTHVFHLDLVTSGAPYENLVAFAVAEEGTWYEVLPCPTAKTAAEFRAVRQRAAADSATARKLAKSLAEPVRGELLAMVKEGQSLSAVRRYAEVTGVEFAMAKQVVHVLASGGH
jgi:hypothetical protein